MMAECNRCSTQPSWCWWCRSEVKPESHVHGSRSRSTGHVTRHGHSYNIHCSGPPVGVRNDSIGLRVTPNEEKGSLHWGFFYLLLWRPPAALLLIWPWTQAAKPQKGNGGEDDLRTLKGIFGFPGCFPNKKISALPVENNVNLGINKGPGNIRGYIAFWFTWWINYQWSKYNLTDLKQEKTHKISTRHNRNDAKIAPDF